MRPTFGGEIATSIQALLLALDLLVRRAIMKAMVRYATFGGGELWCKLLLTVEPSFGGEIILLAVLLAVNPDFWR